MKIVITETFPLTWTLERYPAEPYTVPDLDAQLTHEGGDPLPGVIWALDLFQPNELGGHDEDHHLTSIHITEVDGPVDRGPDWNEVLNEVRNYQV